MKERMEEHLKECEACKSVLDLSSNSMEAAVFDAEETMPIKMMKRNIWIRKIKSVLFASMVLFLVMFTLFSYLSKPMYCSYEKSGITIEKNGIYANFKGNITHIEWKNT